MISGTHVLASYSLWYDQALYCQAGQELGESNVQIHISKPFKSFPGGFPFRKKEQRNSLAEKIFQSLGWVNSFGLMDFYIKKTSER